MGGGGAPEADPNIGIAALKSAELGEDYLSWMMDRSKTTDRWATQDRSRQQGTFIPLQDRFIKDAENWDTPGAQRTAARESVADVTQQGALAQEQHVRSAAALGVNPNSGRFNAGRRGAGIDLALAKTGAANTARRQVRSQGMALRGEAINLGSGGQINPLSSFQAGSNAASSGFSGAMQGYGQQGSLLNQQFNNQMQSYQANQGASGELFGAIGGLAGMLPWTSIMSDETKKTARRKVRAGGFTKAVDKMPVDGWRYKEDAAGGDGGASDHVGPMAQDFQKATGLGDGRTIAPVDAIGVTLGAVRELSKEVKSLKRSVRSGGMKMAA